MKRLDAKFFIASGLTSLLVSVLLLASYLGFVPDRTGAIHHGRAVLAEAIAANGTALINQNDVRRLEATLRFAVDRNPDLLSAAVKTASGEMLVTIGDHDAQWQANGLEGSIDSQVTVPVFAGEQKWGQVELRFVPLTAGGWLGMLQDERLRLITFMGLSCLVVFYIYLSRVLRHLDPSKVIPPRVRSALDTLAEGLLILDLKGRIVLANQAFAEVVGAAPDALLGRSVADFAWTAKTGDRVAHEHSPWFQALRDGKPSRDALLCLVDRHGARRTFMANCSPVMAAAAGKHAGVLISLDDVTLLEQKEAELHKAKDAAEMANRAKSDFLANMSHEIRTPMNAILGFTEVLQRGFYKSERDLKRHLATIYGSGKHLLELINGILDLSKVEAGRLDVEKVRCSPHAIVRDVLRVLEVKAVEKGIGLQMCDQSVLPESIETDPARLLQVITNLVGNAIKFTAQGAVRLQARVAATKGRTQLQFEISDTGVGIASDKLESIFEPFVQEDSSITRRFGGTGLGLTISRRISRALGGDITVRSVPGNGSVFTVAIDPGALDNVKLLTMKEALSGGGERALTDQPSWVFPAARVLVVDDAEENRELLRVVLEEAGLAVTEAIDGRAGADKALAERFDLIMMDIQMPVMDGCAATRLLRERGVQVPIVALTAHAMKGFEQTLLDAGYSHHLIKPIEVDRVLAMLAPLLGGRPVVAPGDEIAAIPKSTEALSERCDVGRVESRLASRERLRPAIRKFAARLPEQLAMGERAWSERDYDSLVAFAHWLKGSAGTVGYDAFTEPAQDLEQLARARAETQLPAAMALVRTLARSMVVPPPTEVEASEQQLVSAEGA